MMNIIYSEAIAPFVTGQKPKPDWTDLSAKVASYGAVGEEIFLRAKTIHYLNQQDWRNFVSAADEYISKYGQYIKTDELNQFAWTVFEGVGDKDLLSKAAEWSKLSINKKEDPQYMDTYANLLYKTGRSGEAIRMEEKAASLSGDNEEIKNTLEKMKRGEPTWK